MTSRGLFKFSNLRQCNPRSPGTYHAQAADLAENRVRTEENIPHDFANHKQQRIDPGNFTDVVAFQNYVERKKDEIRRIHVIMHQATRSVLDIDRVI